MEFIYITLSILFIKKLGIFMIMEFIDPTYS